MRTARYSIQMSGVATVGPKCRACVPSSSSKCARIVRTYVCVQRAPYRMQPVHRALWPEHATDSTRMRYE